MQRPAVCDDSVLASGAMHIYDAVPHNSANVISLQREALHLMFVASLSFLGLNIWMLVYEVLL